MFKKSMFISLGLSLILFSGCVSQNKYREMETELNSTRIQMREEKKSLADLQIQNEKLNNENRRLLESIGDLKLELEKEKLAVEATDSTNPELGTFMDETPQPYSILLSSCQQKESVQKVLSKYKDLDLESYVVKVDLGEKGSWWRIFAGHYESREGAIVDRNKFGLPDKIVLRVTSASHMDAYNSENEAENKMSLLLKNDDDPYFKGY